MSAQFIIGDTREVLASMKPASVDMVFTSPPFLALRSYLPADHPDKGREIGSEATPGDFIDALLDVVEACDRVLTETGSLVFELGDTYSGSGGAGGDYGDQGLRDGQPKFVGSNGRRNRPADVAAGILAPTSRPGPEGRDLIEGWPLAKSLTLIPESFRWALAYGRNPFTGRETPRWRVRNVVRWCRPNPPVGALGDKFRPGTSDLAVCCKSKTRWFDLDAVREKKDRPPHTDNRGEHRRGGIGGRTDQVMNPVDENGHRIQENANGAPPLDWWEIPTQPYAGSHYATFPEKLVMRPVEAMCPREVCRDCGEPRRRLVSIDHVPNRNTNGPQSIDRKHLDGGSAGYDVRAERHSETTGWTDCGHDNYRRGIVLDPFAGSGTTLAVAEGLGRDSVGIDLDERNADLARERVGMFLSVVEPSEQLPIGAKVSD